MNTVKLAIAAAVALFAVSGTSHAGTDTANLGVSATVSNNCAISATAALAFGSYDPAVAHASTGSDLDGTGTISVTCTSGASVDITLGQGGNADTGSTDAAPARRMTDGGTSFLAYTLFQDSGRATAWANDAAGAKGTIGTGAAESHTVYGRVAKGQNVPAGSYSDTVVATVTF